jgi:hypothetical protein
LIAFVAAFAGLLAVAALALDERPDAFVGGACAIVAAFVATLVAAVALPRRRQAATLERRHRSGRASMPGRSRAS